MKTSKYLIKQLIGTVVFFTIPFLSAGTVLFWQVWVYVSLGLCMFFLGQTKLAISSELQQERSKPGQGTKAWDKLILLLSFLTTIAMFLVAGIDAGCYHWSPELPLSFFLIGFGFTAIGQFLFLLAQHQNPFFSSTVRIQTDRNHRVYDQGLYRMVRHPAYFGSFIQSLGFPFFFSSLWSLLPVLVSIILLLLRTNLEDQTLNDELEGFKEYRSKTPYKLIPFVW